MKNSFGKRVAAGAGVIVIGALGSGLWDLIVKPGGQWVLRSVLTFVTLGSSALKDSVYIEAAKGPHEASSLFFLSALAAVLAVIPLIMFVETLEIHIKSRSAQLIDDDSVGSNPTTSRTPSRVRARFFKNIKFLYSLNLLMLVLTGILGVPILKIGEANNVSTHFFQSLTICAPFMSESQRDLFRSRYARVNGKADYLTILRDLGTIAATNHVSLPSYEPW